MKQEISAKMPQPLTKLSFERRWQQQLHPMPSVLAIISREADNVTSYLLIKRKKEPHVGKWALVGGKWDFGESLSEAVVREVKEETGLTAEFLTLRALVNYRLMPRGEADDGAHFLLFVCEVSPPRGDAREQAEGQVCWFSTKELEELNAAKQVVATDYILLEQCQNPALSLAYVEAEVIAGRQTNHVIDVVRFKAVS